MGKRKSITNQFRISAIAVCQPPVFHEFENAAAAFPDANLYRNDGLGMSNLRSPTFKFKGNKGKMRSAAREMSFIQGKKQVPCLPHFPQMGSDILSGGSAGSGAALVPLRRHFRSVRWAAVRISRGAADKGANRKRVRELTQHRSHYN